MQAAGACGACLSAGRALAPPGPLRAAYALLVPAPAPSAAQFQDMLICWECRALMRKILLFGSRVRTTHHILCEYLEQSQRGEQPALETLSNHFASSLQHSRTICHSITDFPSPQHVDSEDADLDQIKAELFDISDDDANATETSIKKELHFEDMDEIPLIHHKTEERRPKSKSKVKKRKKKSISDLKLVSNESDNDIGNDVSVEEMAVADVSELLLEASERIHTGNLKKVRKPMKKVAVTGKKKPMKNDNKESKKIRKVKNLAQQVPESERYRRVLVSEQQLLQWRDEDSKDDRYATNRLPHKCTTCLLPFRWDEQLLRHNEKKHDPSLGPVTCDVCACRFAAEQEMQTHRELHYTRYECLHCEYVTRDNKDIDKHYEMEHCEPNYHCTICGEAFKTFFQQRYHREAAHRPLWECQHCDKKFRLRGGLYSHMRVHQELPKAACPICSKVYKNKYALMYHLRVHEQSKWPFYCQQCDVHFKSKNQLRLHMTTSMKHVTPDKLKFSCEACGRRFITDKRREHHYNSVHLNKTEFHCTECSKAYANKQSLRSHILRKHKQATPPRDRICDICGKGFHNNVLLKNHMRSHTGERPFLCKLCPSTFSYSAALYTHNRLVHLKMKREKSHKKKAPVLPYQEKAQWEGEPFSY